MNQFLFLPQHPLHRTYAHRKRKFRAWPKCIGQRLPNLQQLDDDLKVPINERNHNPSILRFFSFFFRGQTKR